MSEEKSNWQKKKMVSPPIKYAAPLVKVVFWSSVLIAAAFSVDALMNKRKHMVWG